MATAGDPGEPRLWPAGLPNWLWGPLAGGILLAAVAGLSLASGQPWLIPSLGPTAYMQTTLPAQRQSRFYHVLVGHYVAIGAGYLALLLLGAQHAPSMVCTHQVVEIRLWAAVLALTLDLLGDFAARASHPPAGTTSLLIALGAFRWRLLDAVTIAIAILLIAVLGECVRAARARQRPFVGR